MFKRLMMLTGAACLALCGSVFAKPVPPGSLQAERIAFRIIVYFPSAPSNDPMALLRSRVSQSPGLVLVKDIPKSPTGMTVFGVVERALPAGVVPDEVALSYFGRGLSKDNSKALQASKHALMMVFSHPKKHAFEGLRAAYIVAERVARDGRGFLWDDESREMFTPDAWKDKRIATWPGGVPVVGHSTSIHSYKSGRLVRDISLGMAKFGLPDIVVDQHAVSSNRSIGNLMNLLSQAMAEGAVVGTDGHFDLSIAAIANKKVREEQLPHILPNSKGVAKLALNEGTREEGDPDNRLVEVSFKRYPGSDNSSRQDALLSDLFGSTDRIERIQHDAQLLAASKRARTRLIAMESDFNRGLEPGEHIQVKAPFETSDGGTEWMWVEITQWKNRQIEGLLRNEPFNVPALRSGQVVKIEVDDVFDYIRYYRNGRTEGNTTSAIIEKMQKSN